MINGRAAIPGSWKAPTSSVKETTAESLMLDPPGCDKALEIGCDAGAFTRLLAPRAQRVLALDVSSTGIAATQGACRTLSQTEFRVRNIMDYDSKQKGLRDLIIMSETIYCFGWLYSFFDACWLASELFTATAPGRHLLLANTRGQISDPLLHRCVIGTYHDLVLHVGFQADAQEIFRGHKYGVGLDVIISSYRKPLSAGMVSD